MERPCKRPRTVVGMFWNVRKSCSAVGTDASEHVSSASVPQSGMVPASSIRVSGISGVACSWAISNGKFVMLQRP